MLIHKTDYEAEYEVREPFRWPYHPGSKLHYLLKASLERVDASIAQRLLSPRVPRDTRHFSLRAGEPAPAALLPVLPAPGSGPQGTLAPGTRLTVRLRRLGSAECSVDRCIEDGLGLLSMELAAVRVDRCSPRERSCRVLDAPREEQRVSVTFVTPAHIATRRFVKPDLRFATFIMHARRRLEMLCALYGDLPEGASAFFRDELLPLVKHVRCVQSGLRVEKWLRKARKCRGETSRHKMVGLLGTVVYEGLLGPFIPTLLIASDVHVGKLASMGLGRLDVATGVRARAIPRKGVETALGTDEPEDPDGPERPHARERALKHVVLGSTTCPRKGVET